MHRRLSGPDWEVIKKRYVRNTYFLTMLERLTKIRKVRGRIETSFAVNWSVCTRIPDIWCQASHFDEMGDIPLGHIILFRPFTH